MPQLRKESEVADPLTEEWLREEYAKLTELGVEKQYHLESIARDVATDYSLRCPACGSTRSSYGTLFSDYRDYPPDESTDEGNSWCCHSCGTIFDREDCPE